MSEPDRDTLPHPSVLDAGDDHAPGDEPRDDAGHWIANAHIGLGFSVILTVAAFVLAGSRLIYAPAIPVALIVLAIAQMGVHLVFFLHITTGPDNTNNVLALAFGVLIVFLVMIGTIWIMAHMNANMAPDPNMMNLMTQRG